MNSTSINTGVFQVSKVTTCIALFQSRVLLLLEGSGLVRLVVVPFVLATRELLDQVGAGLILIPFLRYVLLPSLLLNIKSRYQIFQLISPVYCVSDLWRSSSTGKVTLQ